MTEQEDLINILKQRGKKQEEKVQDIIKYYEGPIYYAVTRNAHAAIETVQEYGLVIGVDANGYASELHFPNGAFSE